MVVGHVVGHDHAVEAHVAHIERVNGAINAVVRTRFEEARAEADAVDRTLSADRPDQVPPFFGVPCTIKECFAMAGMPHTSGLVSRKGVTATEDATAVARLKGAGAIPLGAIGPTHKTVEILSNLLHTSVKQVLAG